MAMAKRAVKEVAAAETIAATAIPINIDDYLIVRGPTSVEHCSRDGECKQSGATEGDVIVGRKNFGCQLRYDTALDYTPRVLCDLCIEDIRHTLISIHAQDEQIEPPTAAETTNQSPTIPTELRPSENGTLVSSHEPTAYSI